MDLGPAPEGAFQLLSRIVELAEVDEPVRQRMLEQLEVHHGVLRRFPVLRARKAPDMDVFSDSEEEALSAVLKEFGATPARELVDRTHEHRAYALANSNRTAGSSVDLPYEYFFEDAPAELHSIKALAQDEQQDRDFAKALRSAS